MMQAGGGQGLRPEPGGEVRQAAWDRFYDFCFKIINNSPGVRKLSTVDREDCVQEVMLELVRKFGEGHIEGLEDEIGGWVYVVAGNKAADIARRRTRKPEVGFDDGSGEAVPAESGPAALDVGESISLVWESLLALDQQVTPSSYVVFFLRTIEEWSVPEVAEMMGMTPEQVRFRTHRVKARFAEILTERESGLS